MTAQQDDDEEEEHSKDAKHQKKAERPDTPGEARFREILSLGTQARASPPLEYGDPLNGGMQTANVDRSVRHSCLCSWPAV